MRLGMMLAGLVLLGGCATGSPPGGRLFATTYQHRALTPVAAPRPAPPPPEAPGSAPGKTPSRLAARPAPPSGTREDVLAAARGLVGQKQVRVAGRTWPSDCTGFVEAVYSEAGVSFRSAAQAGDNGVTAFYRYARAQGRVYTKGKPRPGDLVFFRETYDRNKDGRRNDGLTHVGLVDAVEADGTVVVIHRVSRGVVRYRMNLARPGLGKDPRTGVVLNDMLRVSKGNKMPVLTGQLFVAYGSVLPESSARTVARR
ncbi:CHAP domain-containing protein [Archangium primigenium]|uniref:CHAP domain-containing protein n=1 Tax=[Archangium] primigenium TaxID=2792470 RepID=UPI00195A27D5|nr:CHAP domain-containing protein [Archangium primigenium]MBM7116912.1 CHAP domain-containing protein [Archangium primigenium]